MLIDPDCLDRGISLFVINTSNVRHHSHSVSFQEWAYLSRYVHSACLITTVLE